MMATKKFGELLRERRSSLDLSQVELAKRSGVSNKTISEYEAGSANLRADVVVRLALALGDEPNEWLKKAGVTYDDREIEQARRKFLRHETQTELPRVSLPDTLVELRRVQQPEIRVTFIPAAGEAHFPESHIKLICNMINYRWECKFRKADSFGTIAEHLLQPKESDEHCHVALNSLETLGRTGRGLQFIPYPGLKHKLNGIVPRNGQEKVEWTELRDRKKSIRAVTIQEEAGDEYLRSICGYGAEEKNIISVEGYDLDHLVSKFSHALHHSGGRPIVLCAAENVCYKLIKDYLEESKFQLLVDPNNKLAARMLPRYRCGLFVRAEDQHWGALLARAQEQAFRAAPARMAALYADLLVASIPLDMPVGHGFSFARLIHLQNDSFSEEFLSLLEDEIKIRLLDKPFGSVSHDQIAKYILERAHISNELLRDVQTKLIEIQSIILPEN